MTNEDDKQGFQEMSQDFITKIAYEFFCFSLLLSMSFKYYLKVYLPMYAVFSLAFEIYIKVKFSDDESLK